MNKKDINKNINEDKTSYYVLGWEQSNSKIAILCRASIGPLLCKSWKEALKTRTNLLNDPRASENINAQQIIRNLRIYRLSEGEPLLWRPGDLWLYVDKRSLERVEA